MKNGRILGRVARGELRVARKIVEALAYSRHSLLATRNFPNHDSIKSIPAESSPDMVRRQRAVAAVEGERNSVSGLD